MSSPDLSIGHGNREGGYLEASDRRIRIRTVDNHD